MEEARPGINKDWTSIVWRKTSAIIARYGTILAIIAMLALFAILRPGRFLTPTNVITILKQGSLLTIMALGLTIPLIMGDFDLSFAFLASLVGIFTVGLMARSGLSPWVAVPVGLVTAAAFGLVNGYVVTGLNVNSLIATLGTGSIFQGVTFLYSRGSQIASGIPKPFLFLGRGQAGPVPVLVLLMLGMVLIMWVVMEHTEIGRRMYAIGGNPKAAYLAGININRYRKLGFMISAIGGGVSGIVLASLLSVGHPQAADGMMLDAYTAAFLGAVTLKQGEFNVLGTAIGVLFLSIAVNGLTMAGAEFWVQNVIKGSVLIFAVAISGISARFTV